jgi:xylulose-5-phosphate/fructose-6-phosphate phosphoketolase
MFNQNAKSGSRPAQHPLAAADGHLQLPALNVWRQDPDGFSHQDSGFLDHVLNKKAEVMRA